MRLKTARRFLVRNKEKIAKGRSGSGYNPSFQKRVEKCRRIIAVGEDLLLRKFNI